VPEVFAAQWERTGGDMLACIRAAMEADMLSKRMPAKRATPMGDEWMDDLARRVATTVAHDAGMTFEIIKSRNRARAVDRARMVAMLKIRERVRGGGTVMSFPAIGHLLGGRDHSTVIYSCRIARLFLLSVPDVAARIDCAIDAAIADADERRAA